MDYPEAVSRVPISGGHFISGFLATKGHPCNDDAIGYADRYPSLTSPGQAIHSIESSKTTDWKKVGIRTLGFLGGVALGVLTGLALAGIMVTPVGWALAGAVLLIALIAAAAYGGRKELWETLKYSTAGLLFGAGIGGITGAGVAAAAGATSVALAGKTGSLLGGIGMMVGGELSALYLLFKEWLRKSE